MDNVARRLDQISGQIVSENFRKDHTTTSKSSQLSFVKILFISSVISAVLLRIILGLATSVHFTSQDIVGLLVLSGISGSIFSVIFIAIRKIKTYNSNQPKKENSQSEQIELNDNKTDEKVILFTFSQKDTSLFCVYIDKQTQRKFVVINSHEFPVYENEIYTRYNKVDTKMTSSGGPYKRYRYSIGNTDYYENVDNPYSYTTHEVGRGKLILKSSNLGELEITFPQLSEEKSRKTKYEIATEHLKYIPGYELITLREKGIIG